MKGGILAAVAVLIVLVLAVRLVRGSRAEAQPMARPQERGGTGPAGFEGLRELFFADAPLEQSAGLAGQGKQPADGAFGRLASAQAHVRQGQAEEARKDLKPLLDNPETRIRLLAWRALRDLGERPDPQSADTVRGVVCELSNQAGLGTLAVYEDGRARWLGGQGALTIWEAPGSNPEIAKGIQDLLQAAAPLVKSAPASPQHQSSGLERDHFRVTVLTYGGAHIAEAYGPAMDQAHLLTPSLRASTSVLAVLQKMNAKNAKNKAH
ncbi:MAG TPA: hypothetical protein VFR03_01745 [Thermoanaerobaculia bacterium]|nr:hypothetical protein [Thermoanaerobaculia bacterium]